MKIIEQYLKKKAIDEIIKIVEDRKLKLKESSDTVRFELFGSGIYIDLKIAERILYDMAGKKLLKERKKYSGKK